jgi:hypothetical protein
MAAWMAVCSVDHKVEMKALMKAVLWALYLVASKEYEMVGM